MGHKHKDLGLWIMFYNTQTLFFQKVLSFSYKIHIPPLRDAGQGQGSRTGMLTCHMTQYGVTRLAGFRHPTKPWSNCCCEYIESKLLTLFASDRVCWGRCHCCHQELHDSQQEHTLGRHLKNDITIEVKPDEFYRTARYIIRIIWIGLQIPLLKPGYSG